MPKPTLLRVTKARTDLGLRGPDLLEDAAERFANQGFNLEAMCLQTAAREWRLERETGEVQAQPEPTASETPAGALLCEMVGADFQADAIHVRAIGTYNVRAGKYWLVPVVQS